MKEIGLTVIADIYCPTTRTYLSYLKKSGYIPQKIILVHFTGKDKKYLRLRRFLGHKLASWFIHATHPLNPQHAKGVTELLDSVQKEFNIKITYTNDFDFSSHTVELEKTSAYDYTDLDFQKFLISQKNKVFLYTNGGIVPAKLLDRADMRILHIHPGIVPYVKGSDGLLWSILERGNPGVSCFYMNPGIDTGDLIETMEFPPMRLSIEKPVSIQSEDNLYRAILIAYDPHLRAKILCKILGDHDGKDLFSLPSQKQIASEHESYLWMAPQLRLKIFREKICAL